MKLLFCSVCKKYTMEEFHCSSKSVLPQPAKWSPDDKYGEYRRKAKKKELESMGLA
jgi:H/ACA ribonucleoprotein complex subunit 3